MRWMWVVWSYYTVRTVGNRWLDQQSQGWYVTHSWVWSASPAGAVFFLQTVLKGFHTWSQQMLDHSWTWITCRELLKVHHAYSQGRMSLKPGNTQTISDWSLKLEYKNTGHQDRHETVNHFTKKRVRTKKWLMGQICVKNWGKTQEVKCKLLYHNAFVLFSGGGPAWTCDSGLLRRGSGRQQ